MAGRREIGVVLCYIEQAERLPAVIHAYKMCVRAARQHGRQKLPPCQTKRCSWWVGIGVGQVEGEGRYGELSRIVQRNVCVREVYIDAEAACGVCASTPKPGEKVCPPA